MNLEKIKVRNDLKRMVYNYVLAGKIGDSQADQITGFIDNAIGGGELELETGKVLNFPGEWQGREPPVRKPEPPPKPEEKEVKVFRVMPDEAFPEGEIDLRKILLRNGLILYGWEHWTDFKHLDCGTWQSMGSAYRVHWVSYADRCFHYQSGITLEKEIYEVMPLYRGENFGYVGHSVRRQGTGELFFNPEGPDSVVYTLPKNHRQLEIADYIEKYKDFGIAKDLNIKFTLKAQKEQV
jgi:hypothetical protein